MSKKSWRQNQSQEDFEELSTILDEAHDGDEEYNPTLAEIWAEEQEEDERFALEYPGCALTAAGR